MKQKTLILLTLITAIVVVATVTMMKERTEEGSSTSAAFLAGYEERINDVARIEITAGGSTVVVVKNDEDWALESSGGYPAKFEVIKAVLVGLKELETFEGKTSNPEFYSKLGVDAPSESPGSSTQINLADGSGAPIAAIILGNQKPGASPQTYVRKPDEAQAWLINGRINVRLDPGFWIEKQFANIAQDRVADVTIQRADEAPLRVFKDRPTDANFKVGGVPEGREPISESIANSVASGLSFLSLEEVRPASEVTFAEPLVATAAFRSWDGITVRVETTRVDDQNWIRLIAETGTPPAILPEPPAEGEEPVEPAPFQGASPEEIAAEIQAFNDSVGPWAYRVAPYKLSSFEKRLDELLREAPVEAPAPTEAAPAAAFDAFSIDDEPSTAEPTFGDFMSGDEELVEDKDQ